MNDAPSQMDNEAGWDHVAEIIFDSHDFDADCLHCSLCQAGDRAGAWEHFTGMTLAECVAHLGESEDEDDE